MSRLGTFVLGMVVGGAAVFTSLKYHIVRTGEGYELVPKLNATFSETYVDVREFKADDWSRHKTLLAALVRADKRDLLRDAAADSLTDGIDGMLDRLGYSRDGL